MRQLSWHNINNSFLIKVDPSIGLRQDVDMSGLSFDF